jgi:predicted nucleotidyltransferase
MVAARRRLVTVTPAELRDRLSMDPAAAALRLAVLHGSRARADATEGSDWDIGVLADIPPDLPSLSAALTEILGTDEVDVVDLRRTSALLRYRAAREGIPLLQRPSDEFQRFQLEAVQFWCDTETVIRRAHDDVLAALG